MGARALLHKMNINNVALCVFCAMSLEAFCHLFILCPVIRQFWTNLIAGLQHVFGLYLGLSPPNIMFGKHVLEKGIYFCTQKYHNYQRYIFDCSRQSNARGWTQNRCREDTLKIQLHSKHLTLNLNI